MSKFAILSVASIALGAMGVSIPQQQPTKATVDRWSKITSMPASRYNFAASLFANGDVFVGLGEDSSTYTVSSSYRWSRTTGVWAPLATATSTSTTRRAFGVYTTPSDAIRVVGGSHGSTGYLKTTSQLADGAINWTNNALPDMSSARAFFGFSTNTMGDLFVTGGEGSIYFSTCERYVNQTGVWTTMKAMSAARRSHGQVTLTNGHIMVAGGYIYQAGADKTCEIWDPSTDAWTPAASMSTARYSFGMVITSTGSVIVAGGLTGSTTDTATATAERYNPTTNEWIALPSMSKARAYFAIVALNNGSVLALGGTSGSTTLSEAEMFEADAPVSDKYRCEEDKCVLSTDGFSRADCDQFCGSDKYRCETDRCVIDVRGSTREACEAICGPPKDAFFVV